MLSQLSNAKNQIQVLTLSRKLKINYNMIFWSDLTILTALIKRNPKINSLNHYSTLPKFMTNAFTMKCINLKSQKLMTLIMRKLEINMTLWIDLTILTTLIDAEHQNKFIYYKHYRTPSNFSTYAFGT